ncbi:MAG: glutathione S-transferase family protein [Pseudomonadota bacterium]
MKLYHCVGARSFRCLWALEELGADYELETLPFPPRVFAKPYKEINPLGTIPALVDGELTMTESVAICQYVAEKFGPSDLAVRQEEEAYGEYLNWLYRADATLTFPQTIFFRYTQLEPEERRQPQVAEDYRNWFLARWRCVESALETRDYLCADRFTMADICVGYALKFALVLGIEEARTPKAGEWWDRITAREGYQRALKIDG